MEGALIARDRVGVQDLVLLDSHTSESAFLDNLCKRYRENLIYTYIGTLLVSVNPYKELNIYTVKEMGQYKGVNFFELPPHIYAIADNAYRIMCTEYNDHFILISGESGAGKTEASKKILQFFAVTCPTTEQLRVVRDRLLLSNPVLEAFGNAKTLRNDNSSRFGKYMDIQFDFKGAPVGGHILSYLIEKSRVVHQNPGERNFHIFYQLLEGGEEELLQGLGLERNPQKYLYLVQGRCARVPSINDRSDWRTVRKAFAVIEFAKRDTEVQAGSVQAEAASAGLFCADTEGILSVAPFQLLGVHLSILQEALTHRKIEARFEEVLSPLDVDLAFYARDAVAKAIYGRTFTWLVNKINGSLANKVGPSKTVIGLLDIYGFEVFETNSFEQFCINYCNEKLQQLLIEMTLKAEQEEYEVEGIEWEPVPYFNNKIICDLVEEKHKGIISILDEECLRPGEATDLSFLEKLEEKVGDHAHFLTRKLADQKTRKSIDWMDFRLLHYAGEVTYCAVEVQARGSRNGILRECFRLPELDNRKRPETVSCAPASYHVAMGLTSPSPRGRRKSLPKPKDKFDDALIRHQVEYLGLMEHLRVRRAGFAYRRKYEHFLQRYKSLCPETWPHWRGSAAKGVEKLVQHIGYRPEEYKMGRTKIFIRFPRTLFATEDAFEYRKHRLGNATVSVLAAIKLEACCRGVLARKLAKKRMWAAQTIRKYIKGFIQRKQPLGPENRDFVRLVQRSYLMKLRDHLPRNVLDKSWLRPPEIMEQTSELLKKICMRNLVRKYCRGITAERKTQMEQKAIASSIFCGKKAGYAESLSKPFVDTRLSNLGEGARVSRASAYVTPVVKFDRNGFRPRERLLVLTRVALYVVDAAKIKQKIEYAALKGTARSPSLRPLAPELTALPPQGDAILQCEHLFETVTKLCLLANKQDAVVVAQGSLQFQIGSGKEGTVVFTTGQEPHVYKAKNGQLTVVRTNTRTTPHGLFCRFIMLRLVLHSCFLDCC
uniref:Myosin IH n=1 Tax=Varanus komodoensis TaxID=61221 RepID=A0A8D2LTN8_VARKO